MTDTTDTPMSEQEQQIRSHAQALLDLFSDGEAAAGSFDVNRFAHSLLSRCQKIAASIWCVEDVQGIRPDLTNDQAWEVLEQAEDNHDAEYGTSWTTLETIADDLFGSAPETDAAKEE
jgi:hypothetical protein